LNWLKLNHRMLFMSNKLAVSEVFYSIQGEGATMGKPSVFVRLGGCNLMCGGMGTQFDGELHNGATWRCDTVEVWMQAKSKLFKDILPDDCLDAIINNAHLIITGGEPTMQQERVVEFIRWIRELINPNVFVEIETNGTIAPSEELQNEVQLFNVSPKLSNSGNDKSQTLNTKAIGVFNKTNSIFKFVVSDKKDYNEIIEDYSNLIDRERIYLMPAGENQKLLNQTKQYVAELCIRENFNFSTRLHIEIWDKKTGV
jgi:7-carboxy-7-deazaguanine synthase